MLWIGVFEVVSIAMLGGILGGGIMAICQKCINKFNMNLLENHWRQDVYSMTDGILFAHEKIDKMQSDLSTITVAKSVHKEKKHRDNKGYKRQCQF